MTYKSFLAQRNADIDTYENGGYFSRLLRSWPIPVSVLIVIATHLLVETLVQAHFSRARLILISYFLSPLLISTLLRKRKAVFGAIINGSYITLSYCAFHRGMAFRAELMVFLAVLAFGLICGAAAGSFHERLSNRFGGKRWIKSYSWRIHIITLLFTGERDSYEAFSSSLSARAERYISSTSVRGLQTATGTVTGDTNHPANLILQTQQGADLQPPAF